MRASVTFLILISIILCGSAAADQISDANCQAQMNLANVALQNAQRSGNPRDMQIAQTMMSNAQIQCQSAQQLEQNMNQLRDELIKDTTKNSDDNN